ncbi:MAG: hypothetical protein SWO11_21290 [Thermodesulfobacteriota bacterium]|nr:hypothetical protein [Thermodesulfobacteriota bacterium]
MKIERDKFQRIVITSEDGESISSQSVEANLLYVIIGKLEDIWNGIVDVEDAVLKT